MNEDHGTHRIRPPQARLLAIMLCSLALLYIVAAMVGASIGKILRDNPQPVVVDKGKNSA